MVRIIAIFCAILCALELVTLLTLNARTIAIVMVLLLTIGGAAFLAALHRIEAAGATR